MSATEIRRRLDALPQHKMVEFHPTQQCFRVRMRASAGCEATRTFAYGGMTRFLDRFFGPSKMVARPRGAPAPTTAPGGRAGGKEFHEMCEAFMACDDAALGDQLAAESAKFARFLAYTRHKGYRPLASEYAICDPVLGYATAIDALFADPAERRVVAVELKTGYRGMFDISKRAVGAPLHRLFPNASAKNRALAQVYLPSMLLLDCVPAGWTVDAQVWQINDDGVRVYILDRRCTQAPFAQALRGDLVACNRVYANTAAHAHPLHKGNNRIKKGGRRTGSNK